MDSMTYSLFIGEMNNLYDHIPSSLCLLKKLRKKLLFLFFCKIFIITATTAFYLNRLNTFSIIARNYLLNEALGDADAGCNLFRFPWVKQGCIHALPSLKLSWICAPLSFSLSLVLS